MLKAIKATELRVALNGLVLPNGLRVHKLDVRMPQIAAEIDPFLLPEGTLADVELVVRAEDIESFLNARNPSGLSNFSVKIEAGALTILAAMRVIVPVQVGARGHLIFENGKLFFVLERAEVAGAKAPDGLVREHIEKVNPLIDLSGLPISNRMKSMDMDNNEVRITAEISVTANIPRRNP